MATLPEECILHVLDEAYDEPVAAAQLRKTVEAGAKLAERFAKGPRALAVRSLPLTTLPYPTRYAFNAAAISPAPFVTLTHRCLVVQFLQGGTPKTLLFNPSDIEAARATPFFARLTAEVGPKVASLMARAYDSLETQLAALGLHPEDVDYVAFDHFHTQDLRGLLGTNGGREPRFPNAVLLAPKAEWDTWDDLHPVQRAWFVPEGRANVRMGNVCLTENDLALGDGVMLLRTPGHTMGNQTLFVCTESGVWGSSENGTAADSWSPLESRIPGIAATAKAQELDVVMNTNTPELYARQYTSMMLEKTIASRVARAPGFVQMLSSSEVTAHVTAPFLTPTVTFGGLSSGTIVRRPRSAS